MDYYRMAAQCRTHAVAVWSSRYPDGCCTSAGVEYVDLTAYIYTLGLNFSTGAALFAETTRSKSNHIYITCYQNNHLKDFLLSVFCCLR